MKFKLLKDLPFMKAGSIFGTGCWVGGGFGVDLGETHYSGGGSSHNGTRVFQDHENQLLEGLIDQEWPDAWIELVPTSSDEVLDLFKDGKLEKREAIEKIKNIEGLKGGSHERDQEGAT